MEDVTCIRRGPKFGEREGVFGNKDSARETALKSLYGDGFILVWSYMGNRPLMLRIGAIPGEFKANLILGCIFKRMKDDVYYTQVLRTAFLNWWVFGLQITPMASPVI